MASSLPFPHLSLYFGEVSKVFLTHQLEVEAMERASLANSTERSPSAKPVSRSKTADSEADGGYE